MMEYEYCLLGYQNKCTTEWGLLSFIHMQSQSNEHPLHNPSRTWPSLKTLQQCGLFYPTAALKDPLFSTELSLSGLPSICFAAARHVHILWSNYLWLFICLTECKEGSKISLPEQLTDLLTATNLWLPSSDLNHDIISRRLALCSPGAVRMVLRLRGRLCTAWRWDDSIFWCVL